jgi:tRNA-dihydrouridine synthase B
MTEIHFAPLQGFTDLAYCNTHFQLIGNVDYYYTPYFSFDDQLFIDVKKFRKGLFERTIPQILPGNMEELKVLFRFVIENQFQKININLGCPYPMVTKKGRGAGLIQKPELVSEMINYISDYSNLTVSLKTRLGLLSDTEIYKILETINPEKIRTIIIHPRTAKQLYKGDASPKMFQQCKEKFPQFDFIYNGDINSFEDFKKLKDQFQGQDKWMLGRGLLSNPLLGWQIKNNCHSLNEDFYKKLDDFVFYLIENIERDSKDQGHALNRVKSQFIYLSNSFIDPRKIYRVVRKSKSLDEIKIFMNSEVGVMR